MSWFKEVQNRVIVNVQEELPSANIKYYEIRCYPRDFSVPVSPSNEDPWVMSGSLFAKSRKPLEECSTFEQPYFSTRHIQMPTNYSTIKPRWHSARISKDNLSVWANAGIFHDRAFGEWHNVFGPRYFYGNNRRL